MELRRKDRGRGEARGVEGRRPMPGAAGDAQARGEETAESALPF